MTLFAKLAGIEGEQIQVEVNKMIEACCLKGWENVSTVTLSYGMVRRLTLGMALIGRPKLIVLDNPLRGIDPDCKIKLIETILQYSENRALLVATRDADTASILGQKIAILKEGSFVAIGSAGQIIENHGKGYFVEIHADMKKIREQASSIFDL